MREINLTFSTFGDRTLPLGQQGENLALQIKIDCTDVLEEYTNAYPALTLVSPNNVQYPGDVWVQEGIVLWQVRTIDTNVAGRGTARLDIVDSTGTVVRTALANTVVQETITPGEAPSQIDDWLDASSATLLAVNQALLNIDTAIEGVDRAEDEREAAEATRVSNENNRIGTEAIRVSNEADRVSAEVLRVSAETGRADAEDLRVSAEAGRVSAETLRASAEADRSAAEAQRQAAISDFIDTTSANKKDAEAYAIGTKDGVAVENTDPTYHNNSKYYAELAAGSANQAFEYRNSAYNTVTTAIAGIQNEANTQRVSIVETGTTQVENVNNAGLTQVGAVREVGTTQVAAVEAAGTVQVTAVQNKGDEVVDEIEASYGTLVADVSTLKSAFTNNEIDNNAYDVLILCEKHNETHNGITYRWNEDGSCTLNPGGSSSASSLSRNNMFQNANGFPKGIKAGSKIRILAIDVENLAVYIRIFISTDGSTFPSAAVKTVNSYTEYTIPDNATGIRLQIAVSSGTTVNNLKISPKILTETLTNDELNTKLATAYLLVNKGVVADNTDIDSLTDNGNYTIAATRTYDNLPDELVGVTSVLEITRPAPGTGSVIVQRITGNGVIFLRKTANGSFSGIKFTNVTDSVRIMEYSPNDMTANHYLDMGSSFVTQAFNPNARTHSDSSYSWLFIPIKAGDSIYLKTSAGSNNAKPYAIIKHNFLIDSIYMGGSSFIGTIAVTHDGYLAVNMLNSFSDKFRCAVTWDITQTARNDVFLDAFRWESKRQLPEYDDNNVCKALKTGQSLAAMLHHWAIIGASYDSGEFNYTVNNSIREIDWYEYSCWNVLKRMNAIEDMYLYCAGGQNAMDWISLGADSVRGYAYDSDTEVVNPYWSGRSGIGHAGGCWWKMLEDYQNGNVKQVFVVNLGSNDINNNYPWSDDTKSAIDPNYNPSQPNGKYLCGTTADIGTYDLATDTDSVPSSGTPSTTKQVITGIYNSYCAYIGAILNRILAIQPDAIIFLCTIRNHFFANDYKMGVWKDYNDALKEIAEMDQYKNNVYIVDNGEFGPNYGVAPMSSNIVYAHPNAFGYQYIAGYWNTLIDYVIQSNYTKLKQSMFIGTGKKYTPLT